jgi:UDP-N-acetylmuramoyl-tripeptide--D-alanyl-D-alanine ligase
MRALAEVLQDKYPAGSIHYYATDQQPQLIDALTAAVEADDQVLLKGSHGIHLENVLAALQAAPEK